MTVSETYKLEQELETRKDLMFKMSEKILVQQETIQKVRELMDNTVATFVPIYDHKEILKENK